MTDERRPSDEAADRAIDRAVREIMSAEPGAGFRHRVMRRLSEPEPRPWPRMRHGLSAAAIAVLLALAIWTRPSPEHEPASIAMAPAAAAGMAPASPSAPPAVSPASSPPVRTPKLTPPTARETPRLAKTVIAPADRIVRAASVATEEGGDSGAPADTPDSAGGVPAPAASQAAAILPIALDSIVIKDIVVAPIPTVRR